MRKRKVMLIGSVGSGKSTLTKALLNQSSQVTKTQSLHYVDWIIDTPGEYSENPMYYRSLMATSLEAKVLLVIQDATKSHQSLPPNFSQGFPLTPIGVITKMDHADANIALATKLLKQVVPNSRIFQVSAITNEGIAELREAVLQHFG